MNWFSGDGWQRRIKNSPGDYGCKLSDRVFVLLQDVFPEHHPRCFSEALENSKLLRWTISLFSFDRHVRVKVEWAFLHFHWMFFSYFENMFTKPRLFILLDQILLDSSWFTIRKSDRTFGTGEPINNNVNIAFTKMLVFVSSCFSNNALPDVCQNKFSWPLIEV